MNYDRIVQNVIEEHKISPIDVLEIGDAAGEYTYLSSLKESYIRTVRDVDSLYGNERGDRHILEIGSYLGPVSISLKRIGYSISAIDIPEFHKSDSLRGIYERNGIPFRGLNLKHAALPYESKSFDVVVICEVIEHFNFNPLPIFNEINRVLKNDGYIYICMPNQANILNRLKLLVGKSIHNPIDDFFRQLDRNDNMIVGLHWREYTLPETIQLIEKMGFETVASYYFAEKMHMKTGLLKTVFRELLYLYPPFRPSQVVIGKKTKEPSTDFWITEANS